MALSSIHRKSCSPPWKGLCLYSAAQGRSRFPVHVRALVDSVCGFLSVVDIKGSQPYQINYRAIGHALKGIGCKKVIGICSAGSMREEISVGTVVVPEDYFCPHYHVLAYGDARYYFALLLCRAFFFVMFIRNCCQRPQVPGV